MNHDSDPTLPRTAGVDYGILDTLTGFAIRRAQVLVYEDFVHALAPWGITPPRFAALVIVANNPGLKLTELARVLGIARSGAVILADALEALGYVSRVPVADDRRAFNLMVTDKGREDLAAISEAVRAHDDKLTASFTRDELAQLRTLLAKLRPPL